MQKSMPLYQFSSPVSPLDFSIYRRICNGQRASARQRAKLDETKRIVQHCQLPVGGTALSLAGGRAAMQSCPQPVPAARPKGAWNPAMQTRINTG
ncbi:MAG TPA: hypothetical protein IAA52_00780 [Candidatus Pullichristensenella stercorigallinarum]|uniref:Uncharacterized protein n=1 Tax=Candidatus Pullichristensenella stercorigallinarum TaxID=2840909 RepID=A0A9D0ZLG4_9FIRM|nr:hypothetical protein [Candidatus Pullichristensenella stercorigallinarum]